MAKKKDVIEIIQRVVSNPDFINRSQEKELEIEIVAGFDDKDDLNLFKKDRTEIKFWQKPPFNSLLDFELAKESDVAFYDLATLIDQFFINMFQEDIINYKISGIALKSAALLHHYKISSIIREEERIQKIEELKQFRKRQTRTIPKALPQPTQPKMKISTKDELFDAMRAAIIETMHKKEKLRRKRIRLEEAKKQKIQLKSNARLPKELLKHISGKDQTIEELLESWFERIKKTITFHNNDTSLFNLLRIIKNEEKSSIGRKFALVRVFLALMFLSTGNKIKLFQGDEFKDISISLR